MTLMALGLLLISNAWPCGGFFHDPGELAHSDMQMALFDRTLPGSTTVSYAVSYEGDATSFGWVIPIPGEFQSFVDGDLDEFDWLLNQTNPIVYEEVRSSGGFGCGTTYESKAGGADTGMASDGGGVVVVAAGVSATYTYTVLEADSEDALLTWLDENGWDVAESGPSIASYVADGGWQFVAIGLVPARPDDAGVMAPVSITYAGEDAIYPARMARYAMVDELHTVIFVRGDSAVSASGWTATEVGDLAGELGADESAIFADRLRELGGDKPGFGLVYSNMDGDNWLTRFDSLTLTEANTADAAFGPSGDDTAVRATITLSEDGDVTREAAILALPLVLAGWSLRRRR